MFIAISPQDQEIYKKLKKKLGFIFYYKKKIHMNYIHSRTFFTASLKIFAYSSCSAHIYVSDLLRIKICIKN